MKVKVNLELNLAKHVKRTKKKKKRFYKYIINKIKMGNHGLVLTGKASLE